MTTYDSTTKCILCGGTDGRMSFTPTLMGVVQEHTRPKDCIDRLRGQIATLSDRVQQLEYERTLRR